jgi:hypothetical protein
MFHRQLRKQDKQPRKFIFRKLVLKVYYQFVTAPKEREIEQINSRPESRGRGDEESALLGTLEQHY